MMEAGDAADPTNASATRLLGYLGLFSSVGTLLCCVLPSVLVLLGFGATVASTLSAVPWMVSLSRQKEWLFAVSGVLIAMNFYYLYSLAPRLLVTSGACPADVDAEKIDGVSSVKVSLNEGTVTLTFRPTNRVTVERIREMIRSNGFAPKDADVRVAGHVTVRGDSLLLIIPETSETFVLQDAPDATGRSAELRRRPAGARTLVSGQVPASGKQSPLPPRPLLVRSYGTVPGLP